MNTRVILAGLATAVFYFFAGWAIYGIALEGVYASGTTMYEGLAKTEPNFLALIISNMAWAFLVVLVTHVSRKGSLVGGALTGLWVGFLLQLAFDGSFAAFYNLMSHQLLMVDLVVGTLFTAAGGALGGYILGMGKK